MYVCSLQEIVELRARGWVVQGEKAALSRSGALNFNRPPPRAVYLKSEHFVSCFYVSLGVLQVLMTLLYR